jgi:hypothetical protein
MSARSPTKHASVGVMPSRLSATSKISRRGLRQPTASETTIVSKRCATPAVSRMPRAVGV